MKKRIIFIRHGETSGNVNHAFYSEIPDYAISLTEKGHEQAKARGEKLAKSKGWFTFFVSTHHRARQTYEHIARAIRGAHPNCLHVSTTFSPLLREQEWSNSVGKHADMELEKERLKWGVFHYRFPGGESCADVMERLTLFNVAKLDKELKEGLAENIVIVSHGMSIRLHLMALLDLPVEMFELLRNIENCGEVVVEYDNGSFRLLTDLEYHENPSHIFEYMEDRIDVLGGREPRIHPDRAEGTA